MDLGYIKELIKKHEGIRHFKYLDSLGIPTIGCGFNLQRKDAPSKIEAVGADFNKILNGTQSLTDKQIDLLLQEDIHSCESQLNKLFPDLEQMANNISAVLVDLCFNLGYQKLLTFRHFISAIRNQDYQEATNQLKSSLWCKQVKNRCTENCAILLQT